MRDVLFCLVIIILLGQQNIYGQCDFITPPQVKKIVKASREFTFSDVTMNGKQTTYLAVKKGATIKVSANVESKQNGDYCPGCIVQVYWGIRGYTSVCAKSFYGYQFNRKKTTHKFKAPMEDGIYYLTMGFTLDYSCKNDINRPECSPDNAFAVLKVGSPDPEQQVSIVKVNNEFLKASLVKPGCFVGLNKIEWFMGEEKLAHDNKQKIPLTGHGTYKAVFSNCLADASNTYNHTGKPRKVIGITFTDSKTSDNTDINVLVKNSDKFVMKNLIFDLGKSSIKPEAKKDLNELAHIMKKAPSMKILLEGHTDKRGNAKQNQILSENRVKSTKAYLVKLGVSENNIQTKGWGDKKPLIITNDIERGKVNRRVEVSILSR